MGKNIVRKQILIALWAILAAATLIGATVGGGKAGEEHNDLLAYDEAKPKIGGYFLPFAMNTYNPELCGKKRVSIGHYIGERVVEGQSKAFVLSFFASHCPACLKELESLNKVYQKNKDKGFMIMAVGIDKEDEGIEEIKKFIAKNKFKFPVLNDKMNILSKRYGVENLPNTFVFDGEGKIIGHFTAYDEEVHKDMINLLKPLISGLKE